MSVSKFDKFWFALKSEPDQKNDQVLSHDNPNKKNLASNSTKRQGIEFDSWPHSR